jgi:endonuclease YncB( thermonuclease family)
MGLLEVTGKIDLSQFWGSGGNSDADTAKVAVGKITYEGRETKIFEGAYVTGRSGKKKVLNDGGAVTVRWQGIDAPELHFAPSIAKKDQAVPSHDFRQDYGQSSTTMLHKYLSHLAGNRTSLDCKVTSDVSSPNDVFDTYGRLVGDIIGPNDTNLNLWLVQQGLAFPTFYASMTIDEITKLRNAARVAQDQRLGIWDGYTQDLTFDYNLRYEKEGSPDTPDGGPVSLPKLFRRLAAEFVTTGNINNLADFLDHQKTHDKAYLTEQFLDQGPSAAPQHDLTEFLTGPNATFMPADLVFVEAGSTLFDKTGKRIRSWQRR